MFNPKIGFNRISQELGIEDNLNILFEISQTDVGSDFWVAYTLLQNQEEPRIKHIINNFNFAGNSKTKRFTGLRKVVMIDSLERILNWLQQNCPSYPARFLPGLSCEEIEKKVSHLPFKLPKEVYDLYQWRNGTDADANIFVYHYFLDLDTALEYEAYLNDAAWLELREEAGEPLYLFPIFGSDKEFFAVRCDAAEAETAPVFHTATDSSDLSLAFNSLTTMMLAIAESYETGIYELTPEGEIGWNDNNLEKWHLIRLKYNPGADKILYF